MRISVQPPLRDELKKNQLAHSQVVSLKVKLHVSLRVKTNRYVQLEQKVRREA